MSKSLEALAGRVKALRSKKKMTQQQLADKADIHVNTVAQLESMKGSPTWASIEAIAEALGAKAQDLVKVSAAE